MNKTLQTIHYLTKSLKWMMIIGVLVMLGVVVLTDYIFYRTGGFDMSKSSVPGTVEMTAGVFSLLIGLLYFRSNFRVALANGISRKTFMLANLPVAGLVALVFAIANQVIVNVHNLIWPISSIRSVLVQSSLNWLWSLLFQFMSNFMLIGLGWFITFIYYRSNTVMKWVISMAACFVFFLPMIAPEFYYMSLAPLMHDFLVWSLHVPLRAPLLMLIFSAILAEFTFLLIYRAPLKD